MNKKNRGQFYTTNSSYILEGLSIPDNTKKIIEPFAGKGDLLEWIRTQGFKGQVQSYDIEPKDDTRSSKEDKIVQRDTLKNPPDYKGSFVITNPPYLARNKSTSKDIYDQYGVNDLYKCFIKSCLGCDGGIFIIPAGFFFSARDIDVKCRDEFMSKFKIIRIKYFEETVFDDTTTTIVAFSFVKQDKIMTEQNVEWILLPSKEIRTFKMKRDNDWIVGGEIYNLKTPKVSFKRHVEGQKLKDNEQQTYITLNALDSGTKEGRIKVEYREGYIYPAKECSRTYATLRIIGKTLTKEEQIELCNKFNSFLEKKREETWSLFLPQFRESKEYARKRIPFELAYKILAHLLL